jgi:hypothetical protein
MNSPAHSEDEKSPLATWSILTGIAVGFLLWGLLVFYVIGEKGPPEWDFSVIPDIPGESTYSTHNPARPHGRVPGPEPMPVEPQHVMGPGPEAQQVGNPQK